MDGSAPPVQPLTLTRLKTDRMYLRDGSGRYAFFHGINLGGSNKLPAGFDANGVPTYVGKPFPLAEAEGHFASLREYGFDSIRLVIIWEGIEPAKKGAYDEAYLDYLREIVRLAGNAGLYVLLDMHQDMFSRHLRVKFNNRPRYGEPGSVENSMLALVADVKTGQYNDVVQGDGAPRWAVEACLQEKDLSSSFWGTPRIVSGLDETGLNTIYNLYQKLVGADTEAPAPAWVAEFLLGLPGGFPLNQTNDLLPFTHWGVAHALSLDLARCYGCLFAGDKLFPDLRIGDQNVKDYLQEAYAASYAEVAKRVADLPNVIGYDLMNEPGGNFVILSAVAGVIRAGSPEGARGVLSNLLGPEVGELAYQALLALRLLPPDAAPETLQAWGLDKLDVLTALGMNVGFEELFLKPFYERIGQAILEEDPDALIVIEGTVTAMSLLGAGTGGVGGNWEIPMTRPAGLPQVAFAPHWYSDIYPFFGFNQPPRTFSSEEVRYRDYQADLEEARKLASYSLGNIPVIFGEFGSYFNFNGIKQAERDGYLVSAHILDNYYEAFERAFQSRMLWCYSAENEFESGDGWNHEDFSILDPRKAPRAEAAWSRPHARALAGKPISTHYFSDLHYFDPDKGVRSPQREFAVRYESKETSAPSEIVVPPWQYPDGFYVWVSDGFCYYDPKRFILYHYPSRDEPGIEHWVRLLPPLANRENSRWKYFFRGDLVIRGD